MRRVGYALGYALGIGLFAGAIWLLWRIGQAVFSDFTSAQAVTLVGVVIGSVTAYVTFIKTKEKEIEARLFPEKAKLFQEITDVFQELLTKERLGGKPVSEQEVARRLVAARHKLMVWGSADAITALEEFENQAKNDTGDMIAKLAYMYGCFRRDLGHKDSAFELARIATQHIAFNERDAALAATLASDTYRTKLEAKFGRKR